MPEVELKCVYINGGKKASPVIFSKYLENPLKLGKTMIKFISIYGFKYFIVIKNRRAKKIFRCLRITSLTIQRVRLALLLSPLTAEGTNKNV